MIILLYFLFFIWYLIVFLYFSLKQQVNETKRLKNGGEDATDNDVYKFLGVSLNDLPFIDDSKYSSIVDLSWNANPYKPLTNNV